MDKLLFVENNWQILIIGKHYNCFIRVEGESDDYDNEEDDNNGDEQTREDHIEWFNHIYEDEEYPY